MSPNKLDTSGVFDSSSVQAAQRPLLSIPSGSLRFRRNGVEFRSQEAIPLWTEMTVDLHSPVDGRRFNCTGVVVECHGSRHSGYHVSMVFMNLSLSARHRLAVIASSQAA